MEKIRTRVAVVTRPSAISHKGGDVIQMEKTAEWLQILGLEVLVTSNLDMVESFKPDIIHFTGLNLQRNMRRVVERFLSLNPRPKFVMSTIYVSYDEFERRVRSDWRTKTIYKLLGYLKLEYIKELFRDKFLSIDDLVHIFCRKADHIYQNNLKNVDLLLPNSDSELDAVARDFGPLGNMLEVVNNGVDFDRFEPLTPLPFKNFVLCVARIEELKNQINLIRACKVANLNLVLVGGLSPSQYKYFKKISGELDARRVYVGEVPHSKLSSYYDACLIHALPSYFETCSLTTMEAICFKKNVVIGDVGFTRSYFSNYAQYCDPYSISSIAHALTNAVSVEVDIEFCSTMREKYTWAQAAQQTLDAYQKLL